MFDLVRSTCENYTAVDHWHWSVTEVQCINGICKYPVTNILQYTEYASWLETRVLKPDTQRS
jgi:hypothetical protein